MNDIESHPAGNLPPAPPLPPPPPPAAPLPPPPPPPPLNSTAVATPSLSTDAPSATTVPFDDPNGITVLVALGGCIMTKIWVMTPNGVECRPYDNAFYFRVQMFSVETFAKLRGVLTALKQMPSACVIRAALQSHANPLCTVRRLRDHGDAKATFRECSRRYACLDFDSLKITDFPDLYQDPQGCAAAVRSRLPMKLRNVAMFWSFSSSTGMKKGKLGIHLWLLLETPLGWRDAEAFIDACGADVAMSRAVQVHYVAAPRFGAPLNDPLKIRFGTLPGIERAPAAVIAELIAAGRAKLGEPSPSRVRADGTTAISRIKTTPDDEPAPTAAPGMIGDGFRHDHMVSIAGFARSRGVDTAGLRTVLLAENAGHCDPPLDTAKIEALAQSFTGYTPDASKTTGTPWNRAVAAVAGLSRHDACPLAMAAMATCILGTSASAMAVVAAVLAMPQWQVECAEASPALFVPEGRQL